MSESKLNFMWDETPVDVSAEANFIWEIANKLRGCYMPDKYGDVIIPMVIIRRLECTLEPTKRAVIDMFNKNPSYPYKAMCRISGYQFYNTSEFDLKELCNDADHVAENFKSYIASFSDNVQDILSGLNMKENIEKMDKEGCLYSVVKAFSELDINPVTYDSIKMGYIFENLIGRFYQNVDAGQFYTGRDIIKLCVSLLIAEGCDDIFDDEKIITVCDQACGTGGMLSTAYSYLKHYNPTADVRLFGQEFMAPSYAVGLAEMLIKGQNAENFRHADTFKEDCFPDTKMRFLLENPPFGTPYSGKSAKQGQEEAVKAEYEKGFSGRWGAGIPASGDSQLLFMQSAIAKMDDAVGRAAIISNASPLFSGGTSSGESQIRRWLLEKDYIEAVIQLNTDMFYNTGISTYIWILSKNKEVKRKNKIQLIDASSFCHKLRKSLGCKKNEITPEDRSAIVNLYFDFENNEYSKIYDNEEFMYREYSVMQPMQRNYAITEARINNMIENNALSAIYNESAVYELENAVELNSKDKAKLDKYKNNKPKFDAIIESLRCAVSDEIYMNAKSFTPVVSEILKKNISNTKELNEIAENIVNGLSVIDKNADIQKDKKGNIIYDTSTKDVEIVPYNMDVDDYMEKEVLPHIPDAKAFFEENLTAKKPVIKIGAEIPFTKYFYKYLAPESSKELAKQFEELEKSTNDELAKLFE